MRPKKTYTPAEVTQEIARALERNDRLWHESIRLSLAVCSNTHKLSGEIYPAQKVLDFMNIHDTNIEMLNEDDWHYCAACSDTLYPHADKEQLQGITVVEGVCPRCGKHATLIPVSDYQRASRRVTTSADWD